MTTLFSWGYYGWGNHTPRLLQAVDAVETSRGFEPPLFVDIRIRRAVRAKGFQGSAFEKLLGPARHRWMKSLGNLFIRTGTGPQIQIASPAAADGLLDLAIDLTGHQQRLLFFCSCQWPRCDGSIFCHRATVGELVLQAARKRDLAVEVVEWPGGQPKEIDLDVSGQVYAAVRKGRKTVPLGHPSNLAEFAGLPWCSKVTLHSNGSSLQRFVGPVIWQKDQWALPVLADDAPDAERLRRALGLESASAD